MLRPCLQRTPPYPAVENRFRSRLQEVVWTLPDHVDPATVPLAVAPGSQEARHAEATGRLIPSPSSFPRTASSFTTSAFAVSPAAGGATRSPPSAGGPSAAALAAQSNAVTAVRTGKNALLFAGYLVRASAGWSTFTRRYCVVDPAAGSLRCFAHGPSVQVRRQAPPRPLPESPLRASPSVSPLTPPCPPVSRRRPWQRSLGRTTPPPSQTRRRSRSRPSRETSPRRSRRYSLSSLKLRAGGWEPPCHSPRFPLPSQGLLTERNEKSAVPLKGTRLRTEDIPGDVGAGQLNDTPVFTLTTAAGRIHRWAHGGVRGDPGAGQL